MSNLKSSPTSRTNAESSGKSWYNWTTNTRKHSSTTGDATRKW